MVLGKVAIALNIDWHEPRTNSTADILAAERAMQFEVGASVDTPCLNTATESYHIGSEVVTETGQRGIPVLRFVTYLLQHNCILHNP